MIAATIKLRSGDNKVFTVNVDVITTMARIHNYLKDLGHSDWEDTDEEIPLPTIQGEILEKILQWCNRNYKKTWDDQEDEELGEWNRSFLDVEIGVLYDIYTAASELQIMGLCELCTT